MALRRSSRQMFPTLLAAALLPVASASHGQTAASRRAMQTGDMQAVGSFSIDRTEVPIADFARFVAATGLRTKAEWEGGGLVYEAGWTKKPGWTWRTPFGKPASGNEPAVHVTFGEAKAYCAWAGKRLPTDREWMLAAYTEKRVNPPAPFVAGQTYPYPTGGKPAGANCLGDCGATPAIDYTSVLTRGKGPAPTGSTKAGVNGLYDMGANVWEWVDTDVGGEKITRGGSWWYGAAQMHAGYRATKPPDMAVVYIGFRCAKNNPK